MCKTDGGVTKLIWILTRDGHDGPRFQATRQRLAKIFMEHDLNFIYRVCNAAGLSAYHFGERRMAPLSAALAEVILPHDNPGSHLDASGNTTDAELEMKNFQNPGELLCKLWNDVQIGNDIVKCTYCSPRDESMEVKHLTAEWVLNNCNISQYCTQMAKCDDHSCCKEPRCVLKTIIQ